MRKHPMLRSVLVIACNQRAGRDTRKSVIEAQDFSRKCMPDAHSEAGPMKRSDGSWHGSAERKKGRGVGQDCNESPFCLILDIESRLRKMNRVDSQAFLEMLRTIS